MRLEVDMPDVQKQLETVAPEVRRVQGSLKMAAEQENVTKSALQLSKMQLAKAVLFQVGIGGARDGFTNPPCPSSHIPPRFVGSPLRPRRTSRQLWQKRTRFRWK